MLCSSLALGSRQSECPAYCELLSPTQCLFPVQLSVLVLAGLQMAAVDLRPDQAGRSVRDRAVAVVVEVVLAVLGIAADVEDVVSLRRSARTTTGTGRIPLDAPVGEIHAEHRFVAAHRRADVLGRRRHLRIDDPFALGRIAVDEPEVVRVDERIQVRSVRGLRVDVLAAEEDQRVQFLDARQTPVVVSADSASGRAGDRLVRTSSSGRGPSATSGR